MGKKIIPRGRYIKKLRDKMSVSKVYRIFLKGECILEDNCEEVFRENWRTLNNLVGLVRTDYVSEDLSYEIVSV